MDSVGFHITNTEDHCLNLMRFLESEGIQFTFFLSENRRWVTFWMNASILEKVSGYIKSTNLRKPVATLGGYGE